MTLNSYHNAASPPAGLADVLGASDPVLANAAELARAVTSAHQAAVTLLFGTEWAHAHKYFSLSSKYAAWADYQTPAIGVGIHAYASTLDTPLRLTDEQLRSHPEWRGFGVEAGKHPPLRGWLVCPLPGGATGNRGFIQVSDRLEGDFTEDDEANLVRLATLTATALESLARPRLQNDSR